MTRNQKKYMKWAAAGAAAFLAYRWWENRQTTEQLGALMWAPAPRQGPRVSRQAIPAGVPQLAEFQTQTGPSGAQGVSSAVVTPHYLGYGSTF